MASAAEERASNTLGLPYPPFADDPFIPAELSQRALRVETAFTRTDQRFRSFADATNVETAFFAINQTLDGCRLQMAIAKDLDQAKKDISKHAIKLTEDVRLEFGRQGYFTNIIKAEIDETRADLDVVVNGAKFFLAKWRRVFAP